MNNSNNAHNTPREGDRLGGSLAEGKFSENASRKPRDLGVPAPVIPARNAQRPAQGDLTTGEMDVDRTTGLTRGMGSLHFDHKVWLNSLRFYREELFLFRGHLEQYVRTSAVPESMPHVEQYQNRFIRQSEVIDELAHDIKHHDQALADPLSEGANSVVNRPFGIHNELRERMEIFERLYHELKMEFRSWLAYHR